ncbi:type VI secretion system Vgr family protein [Pseudoduganella violaceinigra]|uniref:type VI secretion system Vgr family protein n=1 Tax=Pseudoduganella violaceinigra TaxID=246602 RepID=UPI000485604E|nr:type VI secretion system Vgr family protein [Pseudoduganella violaceinigra]
MDNALLSFFRQDKDLITDNRPLRLRLAHPTKMLEDVLLPQRVQGSESICGSIEYRILCVSIDAFIPLKELIALPVAVDLVTDRGDLRSVCGIVTEAHAGDSDGGLASYQLVLRDALSIMEKRNNTRVFRNKNEVEIVQVILDEWRQTNPIIGTCFRYETDESFRISSYPQREFTMQYNESDAAFVRRLLKRRGIAWYFRADQSNWPSHTMVLFDNSDTLAPNAAGVVRYHRDAATEERDAITSWCAVRTLQPGSVSRFSWNYKNPVDTEFMTAKAAGRADQGESGDQMSATIDDYMILSPHAGDNHDDLCQLGQLAMKRHDLDSKCFHGEGSVRDFCVGEYFELEGHPEIDGHADGEREFVITALQISASNNLPKELTERFWRLLSRSRWVDEQGHESLATNVKIGFTTVRRGIPIVPAYDARGDLPNIPMQSAVVVGPEGEEVYCDELGRVKVRFRFTRSIDHVHAQGAGSANSDMDSAWVRVASSWAGGEHGSASQFGSLSLPRRGSEVLVAFLNGDPDKPVVVGQVYNECGRPPSLSVGAGLPGNRWVSGIKSKEIGGGRSNRLRLDDTPGEISVQLASDHAGAQLNLGYLTGERADGKANPRGEGAELRSTESIALRGRKGVLITTGEDSDRRTLDRKEMTGLLETLSGLCEQLTSLAKSHNLDNDDDSELRELIKDLQQWDSSDTEKSLVALSGEDGIALSSGKSVAIGAQAEVDFMSMGDTKIASGSSILIRAVSGLSVLAHKLGLKLIAANGNIVIQSHNGDIELASPGAVKISAGKSIELLAPMVRIGADGAQANFGSGSIVAQSKGDHVIKSSKFVHTTGGGGTLEEMKLPSTKIETDERVILYQAQNGRPVVGRKYKLDLPDGRSITGVTDEHGRTELATADVIGELQVRIYPEDR